MAEANSAAGGSSPKSILYDGPSGTEEGDEIDVTVAVDAKLVGRIIGKGGSHIQRYKQQRFAHTTAACKYEIPRSPALYIRFTCGHWSLEEGFYEISRKERPVGTEMKLHMLCPSLSIGYLIGKQGRYVRAMREESKATITITEFKVVHDLGINLRKTATSFNPAAAKGVRMMPVPTTLDQAMMQAVAAGIDTGISFQVMLDVKDAGKIFGQDAEEVDIGRGGGGTDVQGYISRPRSLEVTIEQRSCRDRPHKWRCFFVVIMYRNDRNFCFLVLAPCFEKSAIVIGLSMFSLLLCGEVMKTVSSISLLINKKHVGQIIGKAGARINQIRKESGAEILISTDRFLDEDGLSEDNKITVRGPPMAVSKGISRVIYHLQQAVEDAVRYGRAQESYEPPHPSNHQREYQSSRTGGGGGGYKRDRSPSRRGERGYYTDDINRSAAVLS
eukprot:jgi/Bigna1/84152/fgenesh1_pg.124_\